MSDQQPLLSVHYGTVNNESVMNSDSYIPLITNKSTSCTKKAWFIAITLICIGLIIGGLYIFGTNSVFHGKNNNDKDILSKSVQTSDSLSPLGDSEEKIFGAQPQSLNNGDAVHRVSDKIHLQSFHPSTHLKSSTSGQKDPSSPLLYHYHLRINSANSDKKKLGDIKSIVKRVNSLGLSDLFTYQLDCCKTISLKSNKESQWESELKSNLDTEGQVCMNLIESSKQYMYSNSFSISKDICFNLFQPQNQFEPQETDLPMPTGTNPLPTGTGFLLGSKPPFLSGELPPQQSGEVPLVTGAEEGNLLLSRNNVCADLFHDLNTIQRNKQILSKLDNIGIDTAIIQQASVFFGCMKYDEFFSSNI